MQVDLLKKDGRLFKTLLDNLAEGVYFVDTERQILYWNHGAEMITGYSAGEVVGKSCADNILVHVDGEGKELCEEGCPLADVMEDGDSRKALVYLRHKGGHRMPVNVSVSSVADDDGNTVGGIETFSDASPIVALLDEVERLRELSLICPLTKIGNRRYTEQVLDQKLEEMRRNGISTAIAFIDLDRFKGVNDEYGHAVGDSVLKTVAKTLMGTMRPYDFLGRWGGEEFVAVLPHVTKENLVSVANRLRLLVEQSGIDLDDRTLRVTISVGAYLCKDEDTAEAAVENADRLMYVSKANGRNCVTLG